MAKDKTFVCPHQISWLIDNFLRRIIHNPRKIFAGLVKDGMTVLDIGCGSGTFTIALAQMVGQNGKVIAADLQQDMLDKLKKKITDSNKNIIRLHKCLEDKIGLNEKVDFVNAFYMLHEVPDQQKFLKEIKSILNPGGKVLVIEPKFHVTKKEFQQTIDTAKSAFYECIEGPRALNSRSIILKSEKC
jgi:ubiquinone/menaquinone biosynthesis C-methylase UbiE